MKRIPLRDRGGNVRAYAMVDDDDAALAKHKWSLHRRGYAVRVVGKEAVLMHRQIFGLKKGDKREVDHIYGNKLDNRKKNLRITNRIGNTQNRTRLSKNNTSGARGVSWSKYHRRWVARVMDGKKVHATYHLVFAAAVVSAKKKRAELGFLESSR